jgi:hypothetical protein
MLRIVIFYRIQRAKGYILVFHHLLLCITDSTAFMNHPDQFIDPVFIFIMILNGIDNPFLIAGRNMIQRIDQRQGHFSFLDIDASWLSDIRFTIIEQVVFDLKSDPDILSDGPHGFNQVFITEAAPTWQAAAMSDAVLFRMISK